jgi:hypothetical protein
MCQMSLLTELKNKRATNYKQVAPNGAVISTPYPAGGERSSHRNVRL